jgi:dihydroflavonol-4-reductase
MKVLVTGADGLLGSNLTRELISRDFSVRVYIQPGTSSTTLEGLPVEKLTGDLLADDGILSEAVSGCEGVFHCAAITDLWAAPDLVWKVNMEGTRRVLEACVSGKVKRLVYVGSASSFQFGTRENPGDETRSFAPVYKGVAYMESKHQAMNLVQEYVSDKGLDAVIVAPTFMIGPYDFRPSSGELIKQYIKRGLGFASPGGRNFAHVRDVAKAMVSALEGAEKGGCYILGGENLTYLEFFSKVAKIAGVKPPRLVIPRPLVLFGGSLGRVYELISGKPALFNLQMARFSCLGTYYSSARAIKELGMPQTRIENAIEESIQSLKEYGHLR